MILRITLTLRVSQLLYRTYGTSIHGRDVQVYIIILIIINQPTS